MGAIIQAILDYLNDLWASAVRGWNEFWFKPADPTALAVVRVGTGLVLLYVHLTCTAQLLKFVGPNAWIDRQAARELKALSTRHELSEQNRGVLMKSSAQLSDLASKQRPGEFTAGWDEQARASLLRVANEAKEIAKGTTLDEETRVRLNRLSQELRQVTSGLAANDPDRMNLTSRSRDFEIIATYQPHGLDNDPDWRDEWVNNWMVPSIYYFVQDPTAIWVIHGVFLAAILCLTLGLFSRVACVLCWIGHLGYINRGIIIWFGMDTIIVMLLLYMMFGPTGATLSLDRFFQRLRLARRKRGAKLALLDDGGPRPSWAANAVIRMIQIHVCIIYFCAGAAKLQGTSWWNGTAVWMTFVTYEFVLFDMTWLAKVDWLWQLVSGLGVLFTIAFEVGFPFLIWNRRLRPLLLTAGVVMHEGISIFMGLGSFGAIMLTALMAFVSPVTLRWVIDVLFKGKSGYRFTYDPSEPAQLSAAEWVWAADSWKQVTLLDSHEHASAQGGSVIRPDGAILHGLSGFWTLVKALRPLWILWPAALFVFLRLRTGEYTSSRPAEARVSKAV